MGAITLGNKSHAKVAAADGRYAGDTPPAQSYHVTTGKTWMFRPGSDTPSGSDIITVPLRIAETAGTKKARYNGYTIWYQLVLGDTSAPYNNAFLDAVGIDKDLFYGGKFKTDEKDRLIALKGLPKEGSLAGFDVIVATKNETYKGTRKLVASAFAPYSGDSDEVDDDDDFDDDVVEDTAKPDEDDDAF